MMFFFASLSSANGSREWPVSLMHTFEAGFVLTTLVCIVLAVRWRDCQTEWSNAVAFVGGVCASLGLIMPFELAPFFFGAKGEIMLGTIVLILVYPVAAFLFVFLFRVGLKTT